MISTRFRNGLQPLQRLLHPAESNSLLLKSHAFAYAVITQGAEQLALACSQTREIATLGLCLRAPLQQGG